MPGKRPKIIGARRASALIAMRQFSVSSDFSRAKPFILG